LQLKLGSAHLASVISSDNCARASTGLQVDPFDKNSPIKQAAIEKFPPDMFFVLRVVQLLRGMANGEGSWLGAGGCRWWLWWCVVASWVL
jgi:hypothetical protein